MITAFTGDVKNIFQHEEVADDVWGAYMRAVTQTK